MTEQEINKIFLSCEHNKFFLRFWFCFEWPSTFYTSTTKIISSAVAMTISRKLVSLGKKLCLFVYHVEQINNKQWMAKKIAALNGNMWSRMVEGKDKKENLRTMEASLSSFLIPLLEDDRWSLLRFVVATFDFCCATDYTTVGDMLLLIIGSIRG